MSDKANSGPGEAARRTAAKLRERRARQARSLRDNLKKRKQQARSRPADDKPER